MKLPLFIFHFCLSIGGHHNAFKLGLVSSAFKHLFAMLLLVLVPTHGSWAGVTQVGSQYTIDCSTTGSRYVPTATAYTVIIQSCEYWTWRGTGLNVTANKAPTNGNAIGIAVPVGATGFLWGENVSQAPQGVWAQIEVNDSSVQFVDSGTANLTVRQGSPAMDITAMLHIRHLDYGKTETWRSDRNPLHGTLTFSGATAVSGGADIAPPARSVVYTPAPGYVGTFW